jgi:hypothetical protein
MTFIRYLLTKDGRRYLRAVWWTIRANRDRLDPKGTVTITVLTPDNRLRRIHNIPARHVDTFIDWAARRGERVLIGEEDR